MTVNYGQKWVARIFDAWNYFLSQLINLNFLKSLAKCAHAYYTRNFQAKTMVKSVCQNSLNSVGRSRCKF